MGIIFSIPVWGQHSVARMKNVSETTDPIFKITCFGNPCKLVFVMLTGVNLLKPRNPLYHYLSSKSTSEASSLHFFVFKFQVTIFFLVTGFMAISTFLLLATTFIISSTFLTLLSFFLSSLLK